MHQFAPTVSLYYDLSHTLDCCTDFHRNLCALALRQVAIHVSHTTLNFSLEFQIQINQIAQNDWQLFTYCTGK